jgi:broad specificity phosphatase PhoE
VKDNPNPMNRPPAPEATLDFLSEGQQMRLRLAERYLAEYRSIDLSTSPPAVAIQTAQRLANTLGDVVSLARDIARKARRASEEP